MGSLNERSRRHAAYYTEEGARAEQLYRDGRQADGLEHFDRERGQIDAGWAARP